MNINHKYFVSYLKGIQQWPFTFIQISLILKLKHAPEIRNQLILNIYQGFGGCLSKLEINGKKYYEDMTVVDIANTNLDGCPPYYTPAPEDTCQASLISEVYSGSDRVAFDTGLMPYTGETHYHFHL